MSLHEIGVAVYILRTQLRYEQRKQVHTLCKLHQPKSLYYSCILNKIFIKKNKIKFQNNLSYLYIPNLVRAPEWGLG